MCNFDDGAYCSLNSREYQFFLSECIREFTNEEFDWSLQEWKHVFKDTVFFILTPYSTILGTVGDVASDISWWSDDYLVVWSLY